MYSAMLFSARSTFLALGFFSLLASFPIRAQSAASPTPTIHVYSRETVIDVLVTDEKGQPVHGLTRSDFTVEDEASAYSQFRRIRQNDDATSAPPSPTEYLHE